jgi:hypothetical protein
MKNYDDVNYWFVNVQDDLDFIDVIPDDILTEIKNGNIILLASCNNEASTFLVKRLYDTGIPAKNIVLFSENRNIVTEVNNVFTGDKPDVYWSLSFEIGIKIQLKMNMSSFRQVNTLTKKEYPRKFLNFNRRWRLHRPAMVALLYIYQLLDKGHVSLATLPTGGLNWDTVYNQIIDKLGSEFEPLLSTYQKEIVNLPDLYLDTGRLDINIPRLVEDDIPFELTKKLYEDTYFSLVSETYFFDDSSIFFTEKVFKPMAFRHPFVLVSTPNQLEWLRHIGYKTFHPFINEDYDKEPNDAKRMKLIIEEVNRLSNLSQAELFEFIDNVKPIVNHNFQLLCRKKHYGHLYKLIG